MCSTGLVFVGLLLGGMGGSFLSGDFAGFAVVNTLDEPVVFVGVDRDRSHQMDLRSRIPLDAVDSTDGRFLLAPEASQTVRAADVDGGAGPGETVRLFLYDVRGDTAYAARLRDVSYGELRGDGFRIEIAPPIAPLTFSAPAPYLVPQPHVSPFHSAVVPTLPACVLAGVFSLCA
jgi:hypothetical protein